MRAIIQRVTEASVTIEGNIKSSIGNGLLVLVGFEESDTNKDIEWMSAKIVNLRIFQDANEKMNLSLKDINGELLIISQFTLFADTKKGNRPSFVQAAKPAVAILLYESFLAVIQKEVLTPIQTGIFGADMKVRLLNDGPVTIILDSNNK